MALFFEKIDPIHTKTNNVRKVGVDYQGHLEQIGT